MNRLASAVRTAWLVLREIFDEAAYTRFLERTQMTSSQQAYDSFLREKESAAARRVRCC